ncbi:hypothetical protein KEJ39_04920 [Candidatus Bathyarchaeota archaeon]|nr:hypothetical protein [Candidatus Bathyarchaeota archaeon]
MRLEVFSVSLGVIAALAFVSAITSLEGGSPEAATEMLISGGSDSKTARVAEEGLKDGSAYLPLLLSLLSGVLVHQASSRLLASQRVP